MYTSSSKHSSLSPNQFIRAQRDLSPSNKQQSSYKQKYYSSQQVSRMIKSYIQPKILYLRNELQEKNRTIQQLNQKLDDNDEKISRLYNYTQSMIKRQKQSQQSQQPMQLINQLVNDKLKQYWQTVNGQIQKIKLSYVERNRIDVVKVEAKIQSQLQFIKKNITEYIEQSRVKNNSYWLKIKQALNRINSKVTKIDQTLIQTIQQLQHHKLFNNQSNQHYQQLTKAKSTVKKLIQLKKSVQNIYENYSNLLELQNIMKNRLNQYSGKITAQIENNNNGNNSSKKILGIIDSGNINTNDDYKNNNDDSITNSDMLIDFGNRSQKQYQQNVGSAGNTFPMFRKKPISISNNNNNTLPQQQQQYNNNQYLMMSASQQQQNLPQSLPTYNYNNKQTDSQQHFGQQNFVLQYSRDDNNSDVFNNQQNNINIGSTNHSNSIEPTFSTKYYVLNNPTNKKINNSGFFHNDLSPIKSTPSQTSKLQTGMNSPTDLSCLNSSVNALRHNASRSTSFVNLSLQNRNQMSESVKQRLQEIIQLKNLTKPLLVYLDQINYLKNNQGNYIFDTRGNMFKINIEEGKQLQKMGIISFIDKGASNSNQKRKNNQMLDKLTIPENLRSKSSQMPKVRPLIIKQTQI